MNRILSFAMASATAFSLAFTPAPAAAADGEDIAAAIAGIAVLGLIAKAAKDKRDDRKAATVSRQTTHNRVVNHNGRIIEGNIITNRNAHGLRQIKRVSLPHRCVAQLRTRNGLRPVYGQRCLNQRYAHTASLPQHCERLVDTRRGVQTFFGANCLARDGWNVAQR